MTEWRKDVLLRVRERGFSSITAFADAFPRETLLELARNLGGYRGFALSGRFAMKPLNNNLPEGWATGERAESDTIMAHAHWKVGVGREYRADADAAFGRLRALKPPRGWLPDGPDDPLLVEAFRGLAFGDPTVA
jgi:hypothetical protein